MYRDTRVYVQRYKSLCIEIQELMYRDKEFMYRDTEFMYRDTKVYV